MSSSSTCSAQRSAANRANAQRSTGPRTSAGKRTVSQNASTHHAYAADLLQPGESPALFHAHRQAFLHRLCPMDALELCLAERVISATWRLRRLQSADYYLAAMDEAEYQQQIQQQHHRITQFHQKTAAHNPSPQNHNANTNTDPLPNDISPAFLLARALHGPALSDSNHPSCPNTPFERLLTAEQRLQGLMHRALKELRQLQADRRTHPQTETSPFLSPDDEDTNHNNNPRETPNSPHREGEAPPEPRSTRGEVPDIQVTITPPQPSPTPTTTSAQNEATCHNDSRTNHQNVAENQPTTHPQTTPMSNTTPRPAAPISHSSTASRTSDPSPQSPAPPR
jgi:hypothetical protein